MSPPPPKPRPSRTIPVALQAETLAKLASKNEATGKPYTHREVSAWLLEAHGVTASRMAVTRLHAAHDKRGEALIVEALRVEMRDALAPALAKMKRGQRRVDVLLGTEKNTQRAAAGLNALTRAVHELAHLGGVAAPVQLDMTSGGQPLPDAYALLAAAVARLVEEPAPGAVGAADSKPPA